MWVQYVLLSCIHWHPWVWWKVNVCVRLDLWFGMCTRKRDGAGRGGTSFTCGNTQQQTLWLGGIHLKHFVDATRRYYLHSKVLKSKRGVSVFTEETEKWRTRVNQCAVRDKGDHTVHIILKNVWRIKRSHERMNKENILCDSFGIFRVEN